MVKRPSAKVRDEEPIVASRTTIGYFFREAFRRMWISKRTSFAAVGMIAIALLILGSFLLVSANLEAAIGRWEETSKVTIFLDLSVKEEQIAGVERTLDAWPAFSQRRFVSRAEALGRFREWFGELAGVVDEMDENPLPASFEISVPADAISGPEFGRRIDALRRLPGVDDVQYDWEWIAKLRRLVRALNMIGLIAGGILTLAAVFTIANVIRLTMFLYREEIDIMRLVGATERIVRGPFLVEGMLQGFFGGLLALGILRGLFELAQRMLDPSGALLWSFLFSTFLPWRSVAALIAGGVLAGLFGSWISVREWTEEKVILVEE